MPLRRRELLGGVALAALVYGLDRLLLGGDDRKSVPTAPPEWLAEALAEMKATNSPGVAIVLPEGEKARAALLSELQSLLRDPSDRALPHLLEAVYVVVPAAHARARNGETVVLLEPDGRRADAATAPITAATFERTVGTLLRRGGRLARRAEVARTPNVEMRLAAIRGTDARAADGSAELLAVDFASAAPAVLAAEEEATDDLTRTRLLVILAEAYECRLGRRGVRNERPLPFGTAWRAGNGPDPDPCPGCGMMRSSPGPHARDVLEFLAKAPPATK